MSLNTFLLNSSGMLGFWTVSSSMYFGTRVWPTQSHYFGLFSSRSPSSKLRWSTRGIDDLMLILEASDLEHRIVSVQDGDPFEFISLVCFIRLSGHFVWRLGYQFIIESKEEEAADFFCIIEIAREQEVITPVKRP